MTPISPLLDSNLAGLRRHTPRLRLNLLAGPYLSSSGALSARISEALPLITVETSIDNGSRHGMEGALLRSTSGAGWRIAKPFNIRGRAAKRLRPNAPELSG